MDKIRQELNEWYISELNPIFVGAGIGAAVGTAGGLIYKRKVCRKRWGTNEKEYKKCMMGNVWSKSTKPPEQKK